MDPEPGGAAPAPSGAPGDQAAPKGPRRSRVDARGMERPEFLLDFPEDPGLERLIAAFEAGNYALVRRDAEKLAASSSDPTVRDAALELRRRIDMDPLARYLILISVLLLAFLSVWAYGVQPH